jgi:tetratricopeptide (TPR) repeat protein
MNKPHETYIMIREFIPKIPFWILIIILGIFSYHNSFNNGFHFDDRTIILENERVKDFFKATSDLDRIVVYITFAINYSIHGFENLWAWHSVNILIHIINAILILVIGRKVAGFKSNNIHGIAEIASLIFVIHPLMSEPVNYIKARFELSANMFCLLSILFWVMAFKAKGKMSYFISFLALVFTLLSIFSKEIYIFFCPILIILSILAIYGEKGFLRKHLKGLIVFSISGVLILVFGLIQMDLSHQIMERLKSPSLGQYILTELRAFWFGISLFFLPIPERLNVDHYFRISANILEIEAILSILATVALITIAFFIWFRNRYISACIFWIIISYFPYFLLTSQEIIREYTLYLPSIAMTLGVASGLRYIFTQYRKWAYPAMTFLIILLSILTIERNSAWLNDISLWKDAVKKSPKKARPHGNLSYAYLFHNDLEMAIEEARRTIEIDPQEWRGMVALGKAFKKKGNLIMAAQEFKRAIRINPNAHEAWEELGLVLREFGREDAILCLEKAVELKPDSYIYKNNLGLAYYDIGKYDISESIFHDALRLDPGNPRILANIGNVKSRKGLHKEALHYYNEALARDPSMKELWKGIAMSYYFLGEHNKARDYLMKIVEVDPYDRETFENLGTTFLRMGKFDDAIKAYHRALNLDPKNERLHLLIANIYLEKIGDRKKAEIYIKRLKGINPSSQGLREIERKFLNRANSRP